MVTLSILKTSLLLLLTALCFCYKYGDCQITQIYPLETVDVMQIARHDLSLEQASVGDVSQANGRWTVLLQSKVLNESAVTIGGNKPPRTFHLNSRCDRAVLSNDGELYVRQYPLGRRDSLIIHIDAEGNEKESFSIPNLNAIPLVTRSGVVWKSRGGVLFSGPIQQNRSINRDENDLINQPVVVGSIDSDSFASFGLFSERIVIHSGTTDLINSVAADLDSAYRAASLPIPKRDSTEGRTRVMWAVFGRDGNLYVCLSDTPMAGPAYVAVIDDRSGRLVRVIAANLPTDSARQSPHNPSGIITPVLGAVGDQLVIVDSRIGKLAKFKP